MPIPSDEGIPVWGTYLVGLVGDNRRGHIGTGRSVWSVRSVLCVRLNETNQMDQTD